MLKGVVRAIGAGVANKVADSFDGVALATGMGVGATGAGATLEVGTVLDDVAPTTDIDVGWPLAAAFDGMTFELRVGRT